MPWSKSLIRIHACVSRFKKTDANLVNVITATYDTGWWNAAKIHALEISVKVLETCSSRYSSSSTGPKTSFMSPEFWSRAPDVSMHRRRSALWTGYVWLDVINQKPHQSSTVKPVKPLGPDVTLQYLRRCHR